MTINIQITIEETGYAYIVVDGQEYRVIRGGHIRATGTSEERQTTMCMANMLTPALAPLIAAIGRVYRDYHKEDKRFSVWKALNGDAARKIAKRILCEM